MMEPILEPIGYWWCERTDWFTAMYDNQEFSDCGTMTPDDDFGYCGPADKEGNPL